MRIQNSNQQLSTLLSPHKIKKVLFWNDLTYWGLDQEERSSDKLFTHKHLTLLTATLICGLTDCRTFNTEQHEHSPIATILHKLRPVLQIFPTGVHHVQLMKLRKYRPPTKIERHIINCATAKLNVLLRSCTYLGRYQLWISFELSTILTEVSVVPRSICRRIVGLCQFGR